MRRHVFPHRRRAAVAAAAALALALSPALGHAAPDAGPRYLLVTGTGSGNVSVLRVDDNGLLTRIPGAPFASDTGSLTLEITPDGRRAYVGHVVSGSIIGYDIGADGTLREIAGSRMDFGAPVIGVTITPDGSRLFATVGSLTTEVRSFDITGSGVLTPTGAPATPVPGMSGLSLPQVTRDGRNLIVSTFIGASVTSYAIGADASLTQVGATMPTGERPALPAITPNGRYLYISNEGSNTLSGFVIAADGSLSNAPGSPYPTHGTPHGSAITSDGTRMYVPASTGGVVDGYRIGADGSLSPLPGSPFTTPDGTMPGRLVLSPDEDELFVIDTLSVQGTARVHTYTVAPDGSVAPSGLPAADTGVLFHDGPSAHLTPAP
ncbi:lactonase family protein [Nocardia cyriacigeorgica]|uniref:lactonase family protein n=1 Tax=Nocardia cyriacigeorgica TaxID=135487 RepID=UPI0013D65AB1|nr:lactonase family protein [Nocardia cyriacigeorgica]NEW26627.1 lactonase family protein [Nocardia cyriacigeorgica]